MGIFFTEDIVSWFDLETYSKVTEDDAIEQNTYDFLLVFYSNFGHISYLYCASRLCRNDLAGRLTSRMRFMNHNWLATKQRLHAQSVAEISRHSVLSGVRIRQCETSSGATVTSN